MSNIALLCAGVLYIVVGSFVSVSTRRFIGWRVFTYEEDLHITLITLIWPGWLIMAAGVWVHVHAEKAINKFKEQRKD